MRCCGGSTLAQEQAERSVEATIEAPEPRGRTARGYQIRSTYKPHEPASREQGGHAHPADSTQPGRPEWEIREKPAGHHECCGDGMARCWRRHHRSAYDRVGQFGTAPERERSSEPPGDVKSCDPGETDRSGVSGPADHGSERYPQPPDPSAT